MVYVSGIFVISLWYVGAHGLVCKIFISGGDRKCTSGPIHDPTYPCLIRMWGVSGVVIKNSAPERGSRKDMMRPLQKYGNARY